MKDLFNSLGIVVFIKKLFEYRGILNMILFPFYAMYGLIWVGGLLGCFLTWRMPTHIPFPFIGSDQGLIGDRFLLLIGLIMAWAYYEEEIKNKIKKKEDE